jgi:uncharacterized protein YwgA
MLADLTKMRQPSEMAEISRLSDDSRLLLELLDGLHEPVRGRTMMQKIVFLLRSQFEAFENFSYSLHYYGPFSRDLSNQLDLLATYGFVEEEEVPAGESLRYDISITEEGKLAIGTKRSELVPKMVSVAKQLNGRPLPEVIDEAYKIAFAKGLS